MSAPNESLDELKQVSQVSGKSEKSLISSLLTLNSMTYTLPKEMGVSNRRTYIRNVSNKPEYKENDRIIIHLNSGSRYIYGKNCYLKFNLLQAVDAAFSAPSTNLFPFGDEKGGSALDLIREVVVTSASGTELSKTQGVNVLARQLQRWTCDRQFTKSFGQAWGQVDYDRNEQKNTGGMMSASTLSAGTTAVGQDFCIPMSLLSPLFAQEKMIPNFMASGLRIEIVLDSNSNAFHKIGAAVDGFMRITDPEIVIDTFELADPIQKALLQQASRSGLDYWWVETDRTQDIIPDTINKFNTIVRKSASRVLSVIGVPIQTSTIGTQGADSIGARAIPPFTSYSVRLGANVYPQSGTPGSLVENYVNAHYALDQLAHTTSKPTGVSLQDFSNRGYGPSGIGRSLQLEADISVAGQVGGNTLNLYIFFVKLAKVHINNILVKE